MEEYKMCSISVMDNIADEDIEFDEKGICNYYYEYQEKAKVRLKTGEEGMRYLDHVAAIIKETGKGKEYDCVIGVSGGFDSTYVALCVKQLGLRPLAVHFDNGWDSELSVKNIENALKKLDIELYTYVVNWNEFRDLQLSFLKASTPDAEIPTDHAIFAVLLEIAAKFKIKYVISGNNFKTEGLMPLSFAYGHIDWRYIRKVHQLFGKEKLETFPRLGLFKYLKYTIINRIRMISILNYIDYDKNEIQNKLKEQLDWKDYGGKHYESIYTRFFQSYILPQKFKIDKRKVHYSTMIFAGLMTRDEALKELEKPVYPAEKLAEDREYVIKKLGLDENEFERIMDLPVKSFRDYPNSYGIHRIFRKLLSYLRKYNIIYLMSILHLEVCF